MPIDYTKYPPNWTIEIVPRILTRAQDRCEYCGLENGRKVTSIPLKVLDVSRYKLKRFWLTDEGDIMRMRPFAAGPVKQVKVVLTVAHLDHDEENHNVADERLMAMCQICHINYDAQEKSRRVWQEKLSDDSRYQRAIAVKNEMKKIEGGGQ